MEARRRRTNGAREARGLQMICVRVEDIYGGLIPERAAADDATLPELAASIARHGLLSPILVRENRQAGRYALVCGARRLAACRMLGLQSVDALLLAGDAQEAAACFLEEHWTRRAPLPLEEAQVIARTGIRPIQAHLALPAREAARRLALLALDEQTRQTVTRGALTLSQAEPLLSIPVTRMRQEAACIIAQRKLTPEQARRLVGRPATVDGAPAVDKRPADVDNASVAEKRPVDGNGASIVDKRPGDVDNASAVDHRSADVNDATAVDNRPVVGGALHPQAGKKRRAIRAAMEAVQEVARRLGTQGVQVNVSVYSQEKGLCIQLLLKHS